ncbi:MAG: hypothetical protein WDM79_07850 [Terricaulis sp.]
MSRAAPDNVHQLNPAHGDASAHAPEKKPGAMIGALALGLGLAWIAGSVAAAVALLGPVQLMALTPVQYGALAAGILLPALMAWFSGAAARDGARARAQAARLAEVADRLLHPDKSAEAAARNLAGAVRSEIGALDKALEQTLKRLAEVQGSITKQAADIDEMSARAKAGAGQMILGMDRERSDLMKISQDLTSQAQSIGDSISRHTRVIAEAARLAEVEVHAADQALDHRITSFGAAASLITDRTQALSGAAQASADSALRLEHALSNALDVLAKATSLTDAARQSSEQAVLAANSTAGAVRETTVRAIEDAKRVADLIRGEAVGIEREAASALERLREAAEGARSAAIEARSAAEGRGRRDARPPEAPQREWRAEPTEPNYYEQPTRREPENYAPPPRRNPEPPPRRAEEPMFGTPAPQRPAPAPGAWTWRELLSSVEENQPSEPERPQPAPQAPSRRAPADDPVARLTQTVSEPRGGQTNLAAADVIDRAGLRVHEVFSASGLERVAQRARSGTQARRRAVRDAAPDAVRRLSDYLARDPEANHEAMEFLRLEGARIAELLGRGRAAMGAEATRAFLLIDSAAG